MSETAKQWYVVRTIGGKENKEDSPHGIEIGDDGKIRFILNSKTYEMSMVCKRKPKAK